MLSFKGAYSTGHRRCGERLVEVVKIFIKLNCRINNEILKQFKPSYIFYNQNEKFYDQTSSAQYVEITKTNVD